MPSCRGCGNHVTERYRRVFAPEDVPEDAVRVCPNCTDRIRAPDGTIREPRSVRREDNPNN